MNLQTSEFPLSKNSLENKTILITGATRGLGRAIALKVAEYGGTGILIGSNLKRLEALYDEIMDKGWVEPALQPINFLGSGPKEIQQVADSVRKMFSKLDALIHNAARVGQICPIANLPANKWQEAIHVNLNIPFLLTQACLPLLKQSPSPQILFTGDPNTQQAKAYWSAYNASKQGMMSFAQILAEELENTSIKVNCIFPPDLRTAIKVNHYPGIDPKNFADPEKIAETFVACLADQKLLHGEPVAI